MDKNGMSKMKRGRNSISCLSPVASIAGIARFIFILPPFSQGTRQVPS